MTTRGPSHLLLRLLLLAGPVVFAGCGGDESSSKLYEVVLEKKMATVGGGEGGTVRIGMATRVVEIEVPPEVAPVKVDVSITLVSGVTKRGVPPINDIGILVEPEGLMFAAPVKVRQRVPPPPVTKRYVAVVVPDGSDTFVTRGPGRKVEVASDLPGEGEVWEADGDGSGLWGLAIVDKAP